MKAMSTIESSKKINLLLIVLAFVVSSVTLWLLESPLKPMLYFFEAALTLTIYHSLHRNFKKTRLKIWKSIIIQANMGVD